MRTVDIDVSALARKLLPFFLVLAGIFIHSLLSDAKAWRPTLFGGAFVQRGGMILADVIMTSAIVVAIARAFLPNGTKLDALQAIFAALFMFAQTAEHLYALTVEAEATTMTTLYDEVRMERMAEQTSAQTSVGDEKRRTLGARVIYQETGLRIPNRDANGALVPFTPTPELVAKRNETRAMHEEWFKTRTLLKSQMAQLRWLALADLAVLAIVLVPGLAGVALVRRRARMRG